MPQLISDDGATQTFMGDDGQQFQVAKAFVPPSFGEQLAPPPSFDQLTGPPGNAQPDPGPPPPVAPELQGAPEPGFVPPSFPAGHPLANPPPGAAPGAPPSPAPATPGAPPPAAAPDGLADPFAPPPEAPAMGPAPEAGPPSIAPTGPLKTPEEQAAAGVTSLQAQSDSNYRQSQAHQAQAKSDEMEQAAHNARQAELDRRAAAEAKQVELDRKVHTDRIAKATDQYAHFKAETIPGDRVMWAYVAAAIAQLGQAWNGQRGQPNPAMGIINQAIDRKAQEQVAKREGIGKTVGLERDRLDDFNAGAKSSAEALDSIRAAESKRYANYLDLSAKKMTSVDDAEKAKQTAVALRSQADGLVAGAANTRTANEAAARKLALEQADKDREFALKQHAQATVDAEKHAVYDPKTGLTHLVGGGGKGSKITPQLMLSAREKGLEWFTGKDGKPDLRPIAGLPADPTQEKAAAELRKANADATEAERRISPDVLGISGLRREPTPEQKKAKQPGDFILARDSAEGGKVADEKGAVDNASALIDHMIALRTKSGWTSDTRKSPEWQQAKSTFNSAIQQIQQAEGFKRLTDTDHDLILGQLGMTDTTGVRDPLPGLMQARANLINNFNGHLKSVDHQAARRRDFDNPPRRGARNCHGLHTRSNPPRHWRRPLISP